MPPHQLGHDIGLKVVELASREYRALVEDAIHRGLMDMALNDVIAGRTLCPNCKGRGHEGLGRLDADFPCRQCYGQGTLDA